ncbi:hypothetical protein ACFQX7_29265 [Luedemannella flava]
MIAAAAPVLAPYDPLMPVGAPQLPPLSPGFLLGTDGIGRDLLSRALHGWQVSWFAALAVIASGCSSAVSSGWRPARPAGGSTPA